MFNISLRQTFIKSRPICRTICSKSLKFLKEKELKRETNLSTMKEMIFKKFSQTNGVIDWNCLSEELSQKHICRKNRFDRDLMSAFLLEGGQDINKVDKRLFDSMVEFLRTMPNITDNIVGTSLYCHFIGHFHHFIDSSDIQLIRKTTDLLMNKYMENRLSEEMLIPCLVGLSKSSRDNCLHAIQLISQMKHINPKLVKQIIDSSLQFRLIDQSLNLVKKYPNVRLNEALTTKFVTSFAELDISCEQTIDLLNAFSHNLIVFNSELKPSIMKLLDKLSYKVMPTFIGQNGLCLKCDQTMKGMSPQEQTVLLNQFCSQVFNKENDFLMKSFPEFEMELKFFDKFMNKINSQQPLDMVVDGLNLAFSTHSVVVEDKKSLRQFTTKYQVEQIDRNLVETLLNIGIDKYNNVLIVGRKHMKKWRELNALLESQRNRISIFYTMNKTQDDCYMLYAALHNPNTVLVSNDFYRDFSDKMSISGNLFERWLKTHKASIVNKKIVFADKFDHTVHVSHDKRILHIPFQSYQSSRIEWMCCSIRK